MTGFVFFSVLAAALLHASWNAVIKVGTSKMTSLLLMAVIQGCIGGAIAFTRPLPTGEVWIWLIASGGVHMAYNTFLAYAYEQGDLSRVYPLARGAAPMMVLVAGVFLLNDAIRAIEFLGISLLGLGIVLMARGVFVDGESRRLVPFALGSAVATASYSMIDGMGARLSGDPMGFVAWVFILSAVAFAPMALMLKGKTVFKASKRTWFMGFYAAAASYGAYAIVVWAMTVAPIALVTALRETSILFAVLIGRFVFGDVLSKNKALAAGLIVAGVILTRI